MSESSFARSGSSSVLGKLTAEVPKIRIPELTHELLEAEARKAGLTLSEFVRDLLLVRAHGLSHVTSLYEDRLKVVAGNGSE